MLFVDGENFTIRAQKLASDKNVTLTEGKFYLRDVFVWLPGVYPTQNLIPAPQAHVRSHGIRSYYYTSLAGSHDQIDAVRKSLRDLDFSPEVFKKQKKEEKAKGVDIALAKDLLSHAFYNNYDVAVLIAGDGDYVPLVQEVKRLGKVVYLEFFEHYGLNPDLRLASDLFFEMEPFFLDTWKAFTKATSQTGTP